MDIDGNREARLHASRRHDGNNNTEQWRERQEEESEDDPEDEAVEELLLSQPQSFSMAERGFDKDHSVDKHSEGNTVPDSTETDDDDEMGTRTDDQEITAAQRGKGKEIMV